MHAAGWLLRQWGQAEIVREVDQTPVPYSPDREWFTLAITVTPTSPPKPVEKPADENAEAEPISPRTFYYTFIVFPAGDYEIGSVDDETERSKNETRHSVTLTRPFALLDREITWEELIAFKPMYSGFMQHLDSQREAAGAGADWYDTVGFCRWLGVQMGLSESDQSYAAPESLGKAEYPREPNPASNWAPRNWPLELDRRGFRLPTESEWEVASRAGTRTAYGYGSDVALLDRFGWFTENSGKHMHPLRELGAKGGTGRVFRGGCWSFDAADCRSALRGTGDPARRASFFGFRLALSPSSQAQVTAEPGKGEEHVSGAKADR